MKLCRSGLCAAIAVTAVGVSACGGSSSTVTKTVAAPAANAPTATATQTLTTASSTHTTAPKPKKQVVRTPKVHHRLVPGGLVGHVLNDVEDRLQAKGISFATAGGDVILRGDWGVCSTAPAAGQPIHGAVVLHIGHFSCGAGGEQTTSSPSKTVPGGLVGHVLNDVEDRLDAKGIKYTTQGGFVIIRGDWGVCSTTPSAGQSLTGAIVLHIGHFSCGAS